MKNFILVMIPFLLVLVVTLCWLLAPSFRAQGYHGVLLLGPPRMRLWAIDKLGALGEPAIGPLISVLGDESFEVEGRASSTLEELGAAAVPALLAALGRDNEDVQRAAHETLMSIGVDARPALSQLISATERSSGMTRRSAARLIGKIAAGSRPGAVEAAIPALSAALADDDPRIRRAATRALSQIAYRQRATSSALIPAMLKRLEDSDQSIQALALEVLAEVRFDAGRDGRWPPLGALATAMDSDDPKLGASAAESVEAIGGHAIAAVEAIRRARRNGVTAPSMAPRLPAASTPPQAGE